MEFNNSGNGKTVQLNFWNIPGLTKAPGLDLSGAKKERNTKPYQKLGLEDSVLSAPMKPYQNYHMIGDMAISPWLVQVILHLQVRQKPAALSTSNAVYM